MRPNLINRLKEEWNNLDPVDPLRGLIADAIDALAEAQPSKPLTDEQRKAIVVCFTSGKVSVSEVQRKLAISYNEAQQLCQSIVDLKLAQGLQLAPSLDRHGIKGDA